MTDCKFKPGEYWTTRDGRKAYIQAVLLPTPEGYRVPFPVKGCIVDPLGWTSESWTLDGRASAAKQSDEDLIAPTCDRDNFAVVDRVKYRLLKEE